MRDAGWAYQNSLENVSCVTRVSLPRQIARRNSRGQNRIAAEGYGGELTVSNRLRLAVVMFLTFAVPYAADAQVPVDILIDMNGNSVGTQTSPSVMAAGTKGAGIDWEVNDSVQAMKVGPGRFSLPGPIRIGSTTYSENHPHQSLQYDTAFSFNTFRGFLSGDWRALTTAGYLTLGIPNQGDSGSLSDLVRVHLSRGAGAIMQLYNGNGPGYVLNIEAYGGDTNHSAKIPVQPGQTYWYSFKVDYVAGRAFLNVYGVPNFDLIGSVTQNTQSGTIEFVQYGNGQGASAGSQGQHFNYFELSLIDWTNAAFPLVPERSGPVPASPANLTILND
jgi:hypothetical protein